MKIKVAELSGAKLDYWVVKAEGHILKPSLRDGWQEVRTNDGAQHFLGFFPSDPDDKDRYNHESFYSPSSYWLDGGPIIEREEITWHWQHTIKGRFAVPSNFYDGKDESVLVAAMRAYVALKFGEEVEE